MDSEASDALRHLLRAGQFREAAALLGEELRIGADSEVAGALDRLERCRQLQAEVDELRATIQELSRAVSVEVRHLERDLGLVTAGTRVLDGLLRHLSRRRSAEVATAEDAVHAAGDSSDLAVYGLGTFQVVAEGTEIPRWETRRCQQVLALLVLQGGGPVSKRELMAQIWPEASPNRARNNLNVAVHALRRSLAHAAGARSLVVFNDGAYSLDVPLWFDGAEFEDRSRRAERHRSNGHTEAALVEYRRAAALYNGDLFTEDLRPTPWFDSARRRLRARYRDVLGELGSQALSVGDLPACIQWSQALVDIEPWDEAAHRRLMTAHARLGQAHLAIRQFLECARVLRSELGAMPDRTTVELYERIKRHVPV